MRLRVHQPGSQKVWLHGRRNPRGLPFLSPKQEPDPHGRVSLEYFCSIHGPLMESRPVYLYVQMVQTLVEHQMHQMLSGQRKMSELG